MTDPTRAAIYRAEVTAVRRLSPGMVRVALGGPGLVTFASSGVVASIYRCSCRTAPTGAWSTSPWERLGAGWEWPDRVDPAPLRTYTVRAVRHHPTEMDVELNAPSGLYAPPADLDWQLDVVVHDGGVAATCWSPTRPVCRSTWACSRDRPGLQLDRSIRSGTI